MIMLLTYFHVMIYLLTSYPVPVNPLFPPLFLLLIMLMFLPLFLLLIMLMFLSLFLLLIVLMFLPLFPLLLPTRPQVLRLWGQQWHPLWPGGLRGEQHLEYQGDCADFVRHLGCNVSQNK